MLQKRDEWSETLSYLQQLEQYPNRVSVSDMETNASDSLTRAAWVRRVRAVQQESRWLCESSRALRARCQQSSRRYIQIACAWCQKPIRWQIIQGTIPMRGTSHSICPTCYVNITRELGLMNRCMPTAV
jgi:hypothetical protein